MDEDPTDDVARALMSLSAGSARALEVTLRAAREAKARQAAQLERDNDAAIRRLSATAAAAERHFDVVDVDWMRAASGADAANAWEASQRWAEIDPDRMAPHAGRINAAATEVVGMDLREAVEMGSMTVDEAAETLATAVDHQAIDTGPAALVRSASADASVARGLEESADSRRDAVAGDVRDATSRRDRLISAGVPAPAVDARLTADKLSGPTGQPPARPVLVNATAADGPSPQRTSKRTAAKARARTTAPGVGVGAGPER